MFFSNKLSIYQYNLKDQSETNINIFTFTELHEEKNTIIFLDDILYRNGFVCVNTIY